jgi:hypothetical protein
MTTGWLLLIGTCTLFLIAFAYITYGGSLNIIRSVAIAMLRYVAREQARREAIQEAQASMLRELREA